MAGAHKHGLKLSQAVLRAPHEQLSNFSRNAKLEIKQGIHMHIQYGAPNGFEATILQAFAHHARTPFTLAERPSTLIGLVYFFPYLSWPPTWNLLPKE